MLRANLTKSMQSSAAWVALADALDIVLNATVEPVLKRLKARPRLFDMHPDDVKTLFDELGSIASVGKASVIDRPLLLQQRLDEVHQKNTLYPLKKTLQREFSNVRVSWKPLFAPTDISAHPYGSILAREVDKQLYNDVPAQQWFKTSRGILQVNLSDIYAAHPELGAGDALATFISDVDHILRPLLPTRIVYDGHMFVLQVETTDVVDTLHWVGVELSVTMMPCFVQPVYRIGLDRIGSVRVGAPYEHKQRRFISFNTMLTYDFGRLYTRTPTRLGIDRIGDKRVGLNITPPDVRFKTITRSTF